MEELLTLIERSKVPAHPPLEQRWTAASSAPMSPAHGGGANALHSWVGIINYLPEDDTMRQHVTDRCDMAAGVDAVCT